MGQETIHIFQFELVNNNIGKTDQDKKILGGKEYGADEHGQYQCDAQLKHLMANFLRKPGLLDENAEALLELHVHISIIPQMQNSLRMPILNVINHPLLVWTFRPYTPQAHLSRR